MVKIAVFASGTGSNAQNLVQYFKNTSLARVALIVTNNPRAQVIEKAKLANVPVYILNKHDFENGSDYLGELEKHSISWIVLAGFLWMIPSKLIHAYPNKIVNIHPALLPKYGGKGMYGSNVHSKVLDNQEEKTGITIHRVNEEYDKGEIVFQASCDLQKEETIESIAKKVHELEHLHYPRVVETLIRQNP